MRVHRRPGRIIAVVLAALLLVALLPATTASAASARSEKLTLSGPASVAAGHTVHLSGRLTDSRTHHGVAHKKITFSYAVPGAAAWTKVGTTTTDAHGYYGKTFTVNLELYFYARFAGDAAHHAVNSSLRHVVLKVPADGTNYWADDGCHYLVYQRHWYGDICIATEGASTYDVYKYEATAVRHAGTLQYQFNTSLPGWLVWRDPSSSVFQTARWARVPADDPTAEVQYDVDLAGTWTWTTVSYLQALVAQLEAELAQLQAQGQDPTTGQIVTVGGADSGYTGLDDFVNGIDTLGGNAELGAAFSNVYSVATSEPFTPGTCGEVGYYCYPA